MNSDSPHEELKTAQRGGGARNDATEECMPGHAARLKEQTLGQDLAEYAILISMIAVALIAGITLIGARLVAMYTAVAGAF